MIIVDTSIWTTFQRRPESEVGHHLESLLANYEVAMVGPVLVELLQGARSEAEWNFFANRLTLMEFIDTDADTWILAGRINYELMRQGNTLALADAVIAALSMQHDIPLYTIDNDFNRVPGLQLHFV